MVAKNVKTTKSKKTIKKTLSGKPTLFPILKDRLFIISLVLFLLISFGLVAAKMLPFSNQTKGVVASSKTKTTEASKSAVIASSSAQPKTKLDKNNQISVPQSFGRSIQVPILTYHYIGNNPNPGKDPLRDNLSTTPDLFDAQMGYLVSAGYNSISLDTLYAALSGTIQLPPRPVVLTFDDGYIDFYVNAYPILRKYNLHATSFIPTGLMGQGYYLGWDQIKEMDKSGLISFQAHSVFHSNLMSLNDDRLNYELTESKKKLEQELGKPVNFMAYPYGTSDARVWQAAKKAGYIGSAGTWYGETISEGNIMDMPRIKISGGTTVGEFAKKF